MKIKKTAKTVCSLLLSFAILNIICFFYYNVPVHFESESGSTDYVWEKNKFYSKGTEGFAWGKTDANGFNNISTEHDYNPEILIMGTSHTEAFNVAQEENYAFLLNSLMKKSNMNMNAYNIGISGHTISVCMNNFKNAVEEFKPTKYVVMEVFSMELTIDEITRISEGNVKEIHSSANPLLIFLQKIPFVRCVYFQIDKLGIDIKNTDNEASKVQNKSTQTKTNDSDKEYESALNALLSDLSSVASSSGARLIILHHSSLILDKKGEVTHRQISTKEKLFRDACEKNGIEILDMYGAFADSYRKTYHLPYGFFNTAVGEGHLNKYGHKVIADELYNLITVLENRNYVAV